MNIVDLDIDAELARITREIRVRAVKMTVYALVAWAALIGGVYGWTGSLDTTAKIAPLAAYFCLFGWGTLIIYAFFLRSERKQDLGLRMAILTSQVMMETRKAITPLIGDVSEMSTQVKKVVTDVADVVAKVRSSVDKYEAAANGDTLRGAAEELKRVIGENGVVGRVEQHLAAIAEAAKTLKPSPRFSMADALTVRKL